MANEITTTNNTEVQTTYILRTFLTRLTPQLQFAKLATPADCPEGAGNECRWLHFEDLTIDTSALSETSAADNQAGAVSITAVSGTMADYGQYQKLSERQRRTMVAGAFEQIGDVFATAGARTMDSLLYTAAKGSTNYFKAGDTAVNTGTLTSSDTASFSDFSYMKAYLDTQGNTGFSELGGNYAAVIHPNAGAQLRVETSPSGQPTWSTVNKHVPQGVERIMMGDMGDLGGGIRGFESPVIDKVAVEAAVSGYANIVLAKDGLGYVSLDDANPEVIIKTPGSNDTSQPLNAYSTIGWKFGGAFKLLSSKRVIVYYSYTA